MIQDMRILSERRLPIQGGRLEFEGRVVESVRRRQFRILLDNGAETIGYPTRSTRPSHSRIDVGSRVRVELSPFYPEIAEITFCYS